MALSRSESIWALLYNAVGASWVTVGLFLLLSLTLTFRGNPFHLSARKPRDTDTGVVLHRVVLFSHVLLLTIFSSYKCTIFKRFPKQISKTT